MVSALVSKRAYNRAFQRVRLALSADYPRRAYHSGRTGALPSDAVCPVAPHYLDAAKKVIADHAGVHSGHVPLQTEIGAIHQSEVWTNEDRPEFSQWRVDALLFPGPL